MHTAAQRFLLSWDAVPMTPTAESTPRVLREAPAWGCPRRFHLHEAGRALGGRGRRHSVALGPSVRSPDKYM